MLDYLQQQTMNEIKGLSGWVSGPAYVEMVDRTNQIGTAIRQIETPYNSKLHAPESDFHLMRNVAPVGATAKYEEHVLHINSMGQISVHKWNDEECTDKNQLSKEESEEVLIAIGLANYLNPYFPTKTIQEKETEPSNNNNYTP